MLLTHFIWQTVLKPLSGTNAKNGAITPSLTPTIHTIQYMQGVTKQVSVVRDGGGGTNRQGNKCVCGWGGVGLGGRGGEIVPCVSKETVISIIIYVDLLACLLAMMVPPLRAFLCVGALLVLYLGILWMSHAYPTRRSSA